MGVHYSDHGHAHSHDHRHSAQGFDRAFAIGMALNLGFVVAEVVFGLMSHSLALLADAGHNLADVLGLVLAWSAAWLSRRPATQTFTYGYRRSSIMASLINAVFVLVSVGMIAWEAIQRLLAPQPIVAITVVGVATAGIVVNGLSAWLFARGRKGDINIRGAFLHMLSDAMISAGVVIAALITLRTGWNCIDPVVGLGIVAVIITGTWGLLRESVRLSLDGVPRGIDQKEVNDYLCELSDVEHVHHLHIWSMSTTEVALTAHLIRPRGNIDDEFITDACHGLEHRFGIGHATLQIEASRADRRCGLEKPITSLSASQPILRTAHQH